MLGGCFLAAENKANSANFIQYVHTNDQPFCVVTEFRFSRVFSFHT